MGGRTQRLNGMSKDKDGSRPVGRPPKDKRKSKKSLKKLLEKVINNLGTKKFVKCGIYTVSNY